MKDGIVALNVWNFLIVGLLAIIAIILYNKFGAGKTVLGQTLPTA